MALDDGGTDDIILGFDDESTQRTDLNRCRIWGSSDRVVKTNSTEVISVNTMGFYPLNGNPVVYIPPRGTSETFCVFLQKVRDANGDRRIVMITDNCRIHKTDEVSECAKRLDIILCFLPPYSPQYNPIELIWKTVKYELSKFGILCRHQIESIVEEVFLKEAASPSYSKYWVDLFIDILPKKLCC